MLVIFDLDDTLIETSKCLTPHYLRKALYALQEEGLKIASFEESYQELLLCNTQAETAKEGLSLFMERQEKKLYIKDFIKKIKGKKAFEVLQGSLPLEVGIDPVPGAISLLQLLKKNHILALVSRGRAFFQKEKMKKAGVEQIQFSTLAFGREINKKEEYQKILTLFNISASESIVCGDRVSLDLQPAKELGITTVHLRNGRGIYCREPQLCVDYTLTHLDQFIDVVL